MHIRRTLPRLVPPMGFAVLMALVAGLVSAFSSAVVPIAPDTVRAQALDRAATAPGAVDCRRQKCIALTFDGNPGEPTGNHTWNHPRLTDVTDAQIREEMGRTERAITDITGRAPTLMRPPEGRTDRRVSKVMKDLGLAQVLWTVMPSSPSPNCCTRLSSNRAGSTADRAFRGVHNGPWAIR
uniref:polysaccharide deacetylase family protein n=1 Tax=Streptomyces polyasparticus TaxID=2767826 RepID=UPI001F451EBD|nr:polysaccharide deacetylase family protein [Streptomyces polyasparticus]